MVPDNNIDKNEITESMLSSDFVIANHVLIKYNGNDAEVRIPDDVKVIGNAAFSGNQALVSIDLNHVVKIEKGGLAHCRTLKNVVFSDRLESLGEMAFGCCIGLEMIHLPESVKKLDGGIFLDCKNLKSLVFSPGITSIPDSTAAFCISLEYVYLPVGLKCIGENTFYNCCSLKSIIIPDGVETIENKAFMKCLLLDDMFFPESLTKIGEEAFCGCSELLNVEIKGTPTVGTNAFKDTPYSDINNIDIFSKISENSVLKLESEIVQAKKKVKILSEKREKIRAAEKEIELIKNTEIFHKSNKTMKELLEFLYCVPKEFIIKDHVLVKYNGKDKNVIIPGDVWEIGEYAFVFNLNKIVSIDLNNVRKIGKAAFKGCSSLETVTPSDGLKYICAEAFCDCIKLKHFYFPDGLELIGEKAFENCNELDDIRIPKSVIYIYSSAFDNCKSLKTVMFEKTNDDDFITSVYHFCPFSGTPYHDWFINDRKDWYREIYGSYYLSNRLRAAYAAEKTNCNFNDALKIFKIIDYSKYNRPIDNIDMIIEDSGAKLTRKQVETIIRLDIKHALETMLKHSTSVNSPWLPDKMLRVYDFIPDDCVVDSKEEFENNTYPLIQSDGVLREKYDIILQSFETVKTHSNKKKYVRESG